MPPYIKANLRCRNDNQFNLIMLQYKASDPLVYEAI